MWGVLWVARTENLPVQCPRCKSPFWDKARRDGKVGDDRPQRAVESRKSKPQGVGVQTTTASITRALWKLCNAEERMQENSQRGPAHAAGCPCLMCETKEKR